MNTNEELSYEDRQKWFRYHMDNSKINEENAMKQMNEMIRMKINDNPNGSIKQMINRIWIGIGWKKEIQKLCILIITQV